MKPKKSPVQNIAQIVSDLDVFHWGPSWISHIENGAIAYLNANPARVGARYYRRCLHCLSMMRDAIDKQRAEEAAHFAMMMVHAAWQGDTAEVLPPIVSLKTARDRSDASLVKPEVKKEASRKRKQKGKTTRDQVKDRYHRWHRHTSPNKLNERIGTNIHKSPGHVANIIRELKRNAEI